MTILNDFFTRARIARLANQPLPKKSNKWCGKTLNNINLFIKNDPAALKQPLVIHQLWTLTCKIEQANKDIILSHTIKTLQSELKKQANESLDLITLKVGEVEVLIPKDTLKQHDFFNRALQQNFKENREKLIKLEKQPALEELIQYIQTGQVDLNEDNIANLLVLADKYQQPVLKNLCEDWLIYNTSKTAFSESFEDFWNLSKDIQLLILQKKLIDYVVDDYRNETDQPDRLNLIKDDVKNLRSSLLRDIEFHQLKKLLTSCPHVTSILLPYDIQNHQLQELIPLIQEIKVLSLQHCAKLTDESLALLTGLPRLEELDLSENKQITDKGLAQLQGILLKKLDLGNVGLDKGGNDKITDMGLTFLRGMPLEDLDLTDCVKITAAGLDSLQEMPLKRLSLENCFSINEDMIRSFKEKRPSLRLLSQRVQVSQYPKVYLF